MWCRTRKRIRGKLTAARRINRLSYAAPWLIYAAPYWATLHPYWLHRTLLSYTIHCTVLYSVRYRYLVFLVLCEGDGLSYLCPSLHPPPPAKGRGLCSIFAGGGGGGGGGGCGVFLFAWWRNPCWITEAQNYTVECKFKYNGLLFWINLLSIEKGISFYPIKTIFASDPSPLAKLYIIVYLSTLCKIYHLKTST